MKYILVNANFLLGLVTALVIPLKYIAASYDSIQSGKFFSKFISGIILQISIFSYLYFLTKSTPIKQHDMFYKAFGGLTGIFFGLIIGSLALLLYNFCMTKRL